MDRNTKAGGLVPFGYRLGASGCIEIDPDTADLVRTASPPAMPTWTSSRRSRSTAGSPTRRASLTSAKVWRSWIGRFSWLPCVEGGPNGDTTDRGGAVVMKTGRSCVEMNTKVETGFARCHSRRDAVGHRHNPRTADLTSCEAILDRLPPRAEERSKCR